MQCNKVKDARNFFVNITIQKIVTRETRELVFISAGKVSESGKPSE
jgi:hypothetical protein